MINSPHPVSVHDVADHYDELDQFHREIWGEHIHHGLWERGDETTEEAVARLVTAAAERGRIGAGTRVCDVGCGYGATARILVLERGATVSAITVSPEQHRRAVAKRGNARITQWNLRRNNWPYSPCLCARCYALWHFHRPQGMTVQPVRVCFRHGS
jgi:cyclopropane fatty-acyl-phospholipid synthase-like methyltransferase